MVGYYQITNILREHLLADRNVNTVLIGSIDKVDIRKQELFPLANLIVSNHISVGGFDKFTVQLDIMDIVREHNGDSWKTIDNNQDILNSIQAVFERLEASLSYGTLSDLSYKIDGNISLDAFEYRHANILTGWTATFDVLLPNEIQGCGNSYTLGDITFSNTLITFSNNNG